MVSVVDDVPPVARCKSSNLNFIVDATGNLQLHTQSIDDGSSDNCSIEARQLSRYNFDCDDVGGTFPITLTVWDMSGTTNSCTTNITVNDIYDPIVEFIPNIEDFTLALGANGQATLSMEDLTVSITDNCGIASQTLSRTSFDCDDLGDQPVLLTVTDVHGNSVEIGILINVVDEAAPVTNCKNANVVLNANGNGSITAADINDGSSDNCGIASMSLDFTNFDCNSIGEQTVTLTILDASDNQSTCTATVTVETQPLVAHCNANVLLQLDPNGNGSVNAYSVNSGSEGGCGELSFSLNHTTFDCDNIGPNPVVLTVTDVNGATSTCNSIIVVEDFVAPAAICNEELTLNLGASGFATITPAFIDNGSNDACGIYQLQLNRTSFNCSEVGPQTVHLIATDVHGNSAVCSATVHVMDNSFPTALCKNATVYLDANGEGTLAVSSVNNGSSDNCGIASMTLSTTSFNCSNVGNNTVTLTVLDAIGNMSTCSATITVRDLVLPTISCNNINLSLDAVTGTATPTLAQVHGGSSDACGIHSFVFFPSTYDCGDVGTTSTYLLGVMDMHGNTKTCNGTINIVDEAAPNTQCQNVTIQLDANGNGTITAAAVNNGSTDICGIASMTLSKTSFNCQNLGANTVTLTVKDASNNAGTCTATLTVQDNVAPTALCKNVFLLELDATGHGSTTAAAVNNGSSDNCGIASMTLSKTNFDCSNANGYNAVTLTVTDASGNVSSCNAYVDVRDVTMPVPVCNNVTIALDPSTGTAMLTPAQVDGGSSDECGLLHLIVYPNNYNCSHVGTTSPYTFIVSDTKGNTTSCTGTVTVEGYPMDVDLPECLTTYYGYGPASCVTINSNVSGGTAPYNYLWNTGATTPNIQYCASSPTPPAPFSLTVTDAYGCAATATNSTTVHAVDVRCGNNNSKVLVCHNGNPICISPNAVAAHLAHGDQLGSCDANNNPCNSAQSLIGNIGNTIHELEFEHHDYDHGLSDLQVFPNPSDGRISIEAPAAIGKQVSLLILNAQGQAVYERSFDEWPAEPVQLQLNDLKSGLYWVQTQAMGQPAQAVKFMIAK